jgi:hypothetical protein
VKNIRKGVQIKNNSLTMNVIAFNIQIKANALAFKWQGGEQMRYKNLRAEMARNGVTVGQLAASLGVRFATVSDKLNGRSRFFYDEATQIKKCFFSSCSLEYLFEQEDHNSA